MRSHSLIEARKSVRIKYNLGISLQVISTGEYVAAVCRDASLGGVGIYLYQRLKVGDKVQLWVHFPDSLGPLHRFGRVVWQKEEGLGFRAGIKFESAANF